MSIPYGHLSVCSGVTLSIDVIDSIVLIVLSSIDSTPSNAYASSPSTNIFTVLMGGLGFLENTYAFWENTYAFLYGRVLCNSPEV